jgi:hypothetical protein
MKDKGKRRRKRRRKTEEKMTGAVEESSRNGTLGQLIELRGRRKEDGRQGTDHVRQGTRNRDLRRGQGTGDKEQRCKTGYSGREARNRDVRQVTEDGMQREERFKTQVI